MTRISESRVEEIRDLADFFGEKYWDGLVDPIKILIKYRVLIAYGSFGDAFDGMLEWQDNRFCVYLNVQDRTPGRIRFTAGHEAGHFFIDEHRRGIQCGLIPPHPSHASFVSDTLIEREADLFSSYLLMPKKHFLKTARLSQIGLGGVCAIANKFDVSISSAAMRYINEVLMQGVVIFWDRSGNGRYSVSNEWWALGRRGVIKSADVVTKGSATDDVMKTSNSNGQRIIKKGTVASEWFPRINIDSFYNDILIEEAMPLGRYGYITLLYPAP